MKKLFICIFAGLALVAQGCNKSSNSDSDTVRHDVSEPRLTLTDFTDVAAVTIDGVVHIKTEVTQLTPMYQSFFGLLIPQGVQEQVLTAFGSGVIISSDGYILTNNHVVQDAKAITVTLNDHRQMPAKLIGTDPATDLALIKIAAADLTFIPFGNSDEAKIGEPVLAIGNPFNLTSTVTSGIISAKARNVNIIENTRGVESPIESFIQTDAAVNSGNSGGALVNGKAELIGVVTAIASGNGYYTGYSFAIPSNLAQKVVGDLKQYGYVQRAYLGVQVSDVTPEIAKNAGSKELKGLFITKVIPDYPAYNAGMRQGDIIRSIAGVETNSFAEMMEEIGRHSPGDEVDVQYIRNGKTSTVKVMLLNSQGNTQIIRNKSK
ncbi:MAG: trypsin-like peptidase domain-containing protein [Bacteroidales bacterium]|nr:trypsin-like peptidase domain-containing protein [Bacteroidales bacterium]